MFCRREGPSEAAASADLGLEGQENLGSGADFGGSCTGFGVEERPSWSWHGEITGLQVSPAPCLSWDEVLRSLT